MQIMGVEVDAVEVAVEKGSETVRCTAKVPVGPVVFHCASWRPIRVIAFNCLSLHDQRQASCLARVESIMF